MPSDFKPFPRRDDLARPDSRFLFSRLSHLIALGFGSGLSRVAPGTIGTPTPDVVPVPLGITVSAVWLFGILVWNAPLSDS